MNKETYEALKNLVDYLNGKTKFYRQVHLLQVEKWIDEVAKEYEKGGEQE